MRVRCQAAHAATQAQHTRHAAVARELHSARASRCMAAARWEFAPTFAIAWRAEEATGGSQRRATVNRVNDPDTRQSPPDERANGCFDHGELLLWMQPAMCSRRRVARGHVAKPLAARALMSRAAWQPIRLPPPAPAPLAPHAQLDEALRSHVGEFGWGQANILVVASLFWLPNAFAFLLPVFIAADPVHQKW